jgi:adenine C2-methylase RlmN of 23S rRNA A2503 and tRNA A37
MHHSSIGSVIRSTTQSKRTTLCISSFYGCFRICVTAYVGKGKGKGKGKGEV